MKKLLAIVLLGFFSSVSAQTVQTTPNLITSGSTHTWTGVTTGAVPAGCATAGPCPGGPTPIYDPSTNTVSFSYNSNAYVGQTIAINNALASVGAGVKINGYNYAYEVRNMNGDDRQSGIDTFTVATNMRGPANSVLLSSNQYFNTKFDWTAYSGTKTATTPYNLDQVTYLQIGITGGDNGYWGGYFGPQIRNVNMSLKYSVDPCITNPAYSPTCANYNTVTTQSVFSGVTGPQAYAINQALSGSGVMVHGFDYGYNYSVGNRFCNWMDFLGGCIGTWVYPSASVNTTVTDNGGATIWNETNNHAAGAVGSYDKALRFSASRPIASMGSFNMTPTTNHGAVVNNMYSSIVYTPDPCVVNPLSSTSCAGYQQAYTDQQCASNPLYSNQCVGYAAAYQTQQCTANPLYSPSCAGYATAYLAEQCSINPLYSTTCIGYDTAYFNQQCGISPLYSQSCSGYGVAYHDQQCSLDPLYASDCVGYEQAYLNSRCIIDSLYSKLCAGYSTAYAIKYLVPVENSSAVNQALSNNAAALVTPQAAVVETVTTTPTTTSATSVTSVTSVVAPPPAPAGSPMSPTASTPPPPAPSAKEEPKPSGPPSARQALAERRQEAAKQEAVAKGKDLAKQMGNAKSMEDQIATQGLVAAAMGYNPAFSAYQGGYVPDANNFYKPYSVYGNQKNVENRSTTRMFGGSEVKHQEMVNSQYKLGN